MPLRLIGEYKLRPPGIRKSASAKTYERWTNFLQGNTQR